MKTELVSIDTIRIANYNPRTITREVLDDLKRSIQEFEHYTPLTVNRQTGNVVGGNQRLLVLKELGYTEVQVVYVNLSLEREKTLNIALNQISGKFDEAKLAAILDELIKIPNFDEELSGFSSDEISKILDEHFVPSDDSFDLDKEIEAIGDPVTRLGDVIQLGKNHRIVCGDSTKEETYKSLLGEEKIDLVHVDLPYGVAYNANNRPGSKNKQSSQWVAIQNDDLKGDDHISFVEQMITAMKPFLKESASVYFWDGFINFGPLTQVLTKNGFHVSNVITWVKPTACPSFADYWFKSEYLLYGWLKSKKPHKWYGPKGESNVWEINREPMGDYQHPTMKPTELASRVIKNSSTRGDIVFDGCMGAGFNLLACQEMGRMFRGIEIEPIYCDVAVRRFIRMFGQNSVSAEVSEKYARELVKS